MGGKKMFFGIRKREPNLFIGGVSATIDTAEKLANKLVYYPSPVSFEVSDIKNFTVIGDDIQCYIGKEWSINTNSEALFVIEGITYFYEIGGFIRGSGYRTFVNRNLRVSIHSCNFLATQIFRYGAAGSKYMRLPNVLQLQNIYQHMSGSAVLRWYVPNASFVGSQSVDNDPFRSRNANLKVYIHPSMATSNGGEPNKILENLGVSKVVYVTSFVKPSSVTDLSASSVTVNSVDLNFTTPSSANSLDFYEVWVDDGTTINKYEAYQEITSSGQTLTGLSSGVTYKIKIVACDIYWNRSEFSNEIEITTL